MANSGTRSEARRKHHCTRCDKKFLRSEHLNRHVLAHDKKKPFSCLWCGTSYGRNDVLQRHSKKCSQQTERLISSVSASAADSIAVQHSPTGSSDFPPTSINNTFTGSSITQTSDGMQHQQPQGLEGLMSSNAGAGDDSQLEPHFNDSGTSISFEQSLSGPMAGDMDFSAFSFENDTFLEDSLLFQFNYNHSGLTVPPTPNPYHTNAGFDHAASGIQVVTPESAATSRVETSVHNALEVGADDLHTYYENLDRADEEDDLSDFQRPSLSRTLRCLVAYFQHFDPHTPLVHFASFSISDSHPALVTIVLAIGAIQLSEHQFARSAYKAVSMLLAQHDKHRFRDRDADKPFYLWYAQTAMLSAQFGTFAGDSLLFRHAQHHLFAAQTVMHQGIDEIRLKLQNKCPDWKTWVFLETCSRVISWLFVLSGMILAFDPLALAVIPPLPLALPTPCDEAIWHAVSENEWQAARRADTSERSIDLWTLSKSVFLGSVPENCTRISAFTLLTLIGGFLSNVTTRQRLHLDWRESSQPEYVSDIERGLATWEGLWRRHPRAEQSSTRLDHPLLNDCLSLLGSTYYHLYIGNELYALKKIAEAPSTSLSMPKCSNSERTYKVIRYAANSWLVRAKLGITYLTRTGGVQLGSQALITAYETALILAWWLHIQNVETNIHLSYSDDGRASMAFISRLFNEVRSELDEQGISYDESGNARLSPIDFYVSLLNGWVWECSKIIEQRLRVAQTRLAC